MGSCRWFQSQLRLVCWAVVLPALVLSYPEFDSKCTTSRGGLPACNFNNANCFVDENRDNPAWTHVKDGEPGPVKPHEKGYVFLDPQKSGEQPRKMVASLSADKKAICADYFYATTSNETRPVNVYIQNGEEYALAHAIQAKTDGEWQKDTFSCCLPNLHDSKQIAIGATSTASGLVAIDYMDIRLSDMPCENEELVCYPPLPSQLPMEPITGPSCPSNQTRFESLSCDFNAKNKTSPDDCSWDVASGWEVRQKWDGTGIYDIIYTNSTDASDASLLNNIPDDVESICLEVQFAARDAKEDLEHVFSIRVVTPNESMLWGSSYNYGVSKDSVWKRNSFDGLLPDAKDRRIQISSNVRGLKLDYIHVRASDKSRVPDTPGETPQTMKIIFSCPPAAVASLCGMTSDPASRSKWSQGPDVTQTVFPDKPNSIIYTGTTKDLKKPASLSTDFIESSNESVLTFSYALSGDADLAVYALSEEEGRHFLWSTSRETDWFEVEIAISLTGKYQITFSITQRNGSTDQPVPVNVGFAEILVKTPGDSGAMSTAMSTPKPTQHLPESTEPQTEPHLTSASTPKPTDSKPAITSVSPPKPTQSTESKPAITSVLPPKPPATTSVPPPKPPAITSAAPSKPTESKPILTSETSEPKSDKTSKDSSKEQTQDKDGGSGNNVAVIVGASVGAVVALALVCGSVWFFYFRNHRMVALDSQYIEIVEKNADSSATNDDTGYVNNLFHE